MKGLHDDPERTRPIGLLRYAVDFHEAAMAVDDEVGRKPGFEAIAPIPVMYLQGHAIELAFKAFLLQSGTSLAKVRGRKLGHDLLALRQEAEAKGLSANLLTAEEKNALDVLNELYSTKQLEYIVTGAKEFPVYGFIQTAAQKLLREIGPKVGYPLARLRNAV